MTDVVLTQAQKKMLKAVRAAGRAVLHNETWWAVGTGVFCYSTGQALKQAGVIVRDETTEYSCSRVYLPTADAPGERRRAAAEYEAEEHGRRTRRAE